MNQLAELLRIGDVCAFDSEFGDWAGTVSIGDEEVSFAQRDGEVVCYWRYRLAHDGYPRGTGSSVDAAFLALIAKSCEDARTGGKLSQGMACKPRTDALRLLGDTIDAEARSGSTACGLRDVGAVLARSQLDNEAAMLAANLILAVIGAKKRSA